MKRFRAFLPTSPAGYRFDADHFSVNSQTGGAQFYRYGSDGAKDTLVAASPAGALVTLEETVHVIEGTLADLSDPVLDKLAELLGANELDDEQKIRLTITFDTGE